MKTFEHDCGDETARFEAELESALLAQALAETGGLPDAQCKALLQSWLRGTFLASSHGVTSVNDGRGALVWEPDGEGYRLILVAPSGLACPLARLYEQQNGTWVALIVAGVRDDPTSAMQAAEWGVSRLTA